MKLFGFFSVFLAVCAVLGLPTETGESTSVSARADSSLVGYLGVFFLGDEPSVYFYLSNGNNALSFTALNDGSPILVPTLGTKGVRDPSIIKGQNGTWYIIGTDLDIATVCLND